MSLAQASLRTKSGHPLHPIGIGTWGLGSYPSHSPGAAMEVAAVRYAISLEQNHIDTAEMYEHGGAEWVVGQAITSSSREDLFITSKLWKDHVAKGTVRPAVEAMLRRLGTDYLDLLYIHAPWFDAPWREAIPQIGQLIGEGLIRHLGVSNFNSDHLQEALALTTYPIAANQMHYSCLHQSEVTPALKQLCQTNGIALVAYLPLERGYVLRNTTILSIARDHKIAPAQVALSWLLARQALPIPRAISPRHIEQNSVAGPVRLSPYDIARIEGLA